MAYTPTTWVNGTTPVNQTNMNHIEAGIKTLDDASHSHSNKVVIDGIDSAKVAEWNAKSKVEALSSTTSTTEAHGIKIDGIEWKLASGGGGSSISLGSITTSTTWAGTGPFTQTVTVTGATVTENSKVDLQPDADVLTQMTDDGCSVLYIVNNAGVLTLTAIGAGLSVAKTIQVTVTETVTA